MGYLAKEKYNAVTFFLAIGLLSSYFTKNMTVVLLISILSTALASTQRIVEGFDAGEKKYKVGEIYKGIVTKIMDYGCFVKIEDGIEGLIHQSELDWTNRNVKPSKILSPSQNIKFKIT